MIWDVGGVCWWWGSSAGNVTELVLLGLPNSVVVRDTFAALEAECICLFMRLGGDLRPRAGHVLKDISVHEVLGHFFLVPPLAHHEEPMWCAIIMEEDEMLPGLLDGFL